MTDNAMTDSATTAPDEIEAMSPVDCDVHPLVPGMKALLPFLDAHWQEQVIDRGILSLDSISYPPNLEFTARPDLRENGLDFEGLTGQVFGRWGAGRAILNCIYGVQLVHNVDMAIAFTRALNDWLKTEWLDRDPRLAASMVLPMQDIPACIEELERLAPNRQFVQALVLANGEVPLGKRMHWPVYAKLEQLGLPLGIHAGSSYHNPVTSLGWPNYYIEDYSAQTFGFQAQLANLITEGVFVKYPGLKVVLIESGVTWLPGFIWRLSKFWRGVRREVPWVDRPPGDIIRDHVRMTVQPLDAPDDTQALQKTIEQIQSDEFLLYASDYPHWQFDGDDVMPPLVPASLQRKIMVDNPRATYTRLAETAGAG